MKRAGPARFPFDERSIFKKKNVKQARENWDSKKRMPDKESAPLYFESESEYISRIGFETFYSYKSKQPG